MRFAITLDVDIGKESYDALNHSYIAFFERFGITPIMLSNAIRDPCAYIGGLGVEGLILTGGNDVSGGLYGETSLTQANVSELRDTTERKILNMAVQRGWPVLGICRGMQFINVFFGGRLIQDLHAFRGGSINHVGENHKVLIRPPLINLFESSEFVVNSYHNQGLTLATMATSLSAFALCPEDGIVEGIIHQEHRIVGIQWHPERTGSSAALDSTLVSNFLQGTYWRK